MKSPDTITLFTRRRTAHTPAGVIRVAEMAARAGVQLRVPAEEVSKHDLSELPGNAVLGTDPNDPTDLALVLGGDGTILSTMRRFAGRRVPVFAINFGTIGFLATAEREDLDAGIDRALRGDFDVLALPALTVAHGSEEHLAVNDVSFHRRPDMRVAELGYSVVGEELGLAVVGYASSELPGPAGNRESFIWIAEAGRETAVQDLGKAARRAEP